MLKKEKGELNAIRVLFAGTQTIVKLRVIVHTHYVRRKLIIKANWFLYLLKSISSHFRSNRIFHSYVIYTIYYKMTDFIARNHGLTESITELLAVYLLQMQLKQYSNLRDFQLYGITKGLFPKCSILNRNLIL